MTVTSLEAIASSSDKHYVCAEPCPNDWYHATSVSKCYKLIAQPTDQYVAWRNCMTYSATSEMAVVMNQEEQDELSQLTSNMPGNFCFIYMYLFSSFYFFYYRKM